MLAGEKGQQKMQSTEYWHCVSSPEMNSKAEQEKEY